MRGREGKNLRFELGEAGRAGDVVEIWSSSKSCSPLHNDLLKKASCVYRESSRFGEDKISFTYDLGMVINVDR